MDKVDCIVVGAGVIGLAVAREMARNGNEVVVLEAEPDIGIHSSSRNSEVIHAGIYYPTGSLKAQACIEGKAMLYNYCREKGIRHKRIGKLIVASSKNEIDVLRRYETQAKRNGVNDLTRLSAADVARLEPAVECVTALLSPSTGLIDSHEFMVNLQGDVEAGGGSVVCHSRVSNVTQNGEGFTISLDGDNQYAVQSAYLINAAGLWSQHVARNIQGINLDAIPRRYLARGHYFTMRGNAPFNHLIYPVAERGGLGIHLTLDLSGQARFGPDVQWIDEVDYAFDPDRKSAFVAAIRKYFPDLDEETLEQGYTGVRPKLSGHGDPPADFVIQTAAQHGVVGLVNLFGMESPGLTAALAIADRVVSALRQR